MSSQKKSIISYVAGALALFRNLRGLPSNDSCILPLVHTPSVTTENVSLPISAGLFNANISGSPGIFLLASWPWDIVTFELSLKT